MIALKDILVVAPMLVLLVASLIPVMIKVFNSNREPAPFVTIAYSVLGLVAAGFLTASMSGVKQTAFSDALVLDGMGVWGTYLILGSAAFAIMMAYDHVDTYKETFFGEVLSDDGQRDRYADPSALERFDCDLLGHRDHVSLYLHSDCDEPGRGSVERGVL